MLLREFQAELGFPASPQPVDDESFLLMMMMFLLLLRMRAFCWQTATFQLIEDLFSPCKHRAGISRDFVVFIMESRDWSRVT
jgi:hypothetical protein